MLGSEWLYGAIALLVGVHVLTLLYTYRRQGEPTGGTSEAEHASESGAPERELVSCAQCGTRNESGYQFCRECVADLSTGGTQRPTHHGPETH
jgi:hypothetical protein